MAEGRGVVGVRGECVSAAGVFEVAMYMVGRSFYHPNGWSGWSGKTLFSIVRDGKLQTSAY